MTRQRDRFVGPLNWSQTSLSLDPDSIRYQQAYQSIFPYQNHHPWKASNRLRNLRFAHRRSRLRHCRSDMALTKRKTRITARRVAEILGCSPKTLYNGGGGTEQQTRIQNGSRQIRFLLEEVLALAQQQEQRGQPKP
jgi:hypothetical protein